MSPTRQDAWSHDQDVLLAEVVLRYIREGGTQLQAFEEVGKRLSRTAAACGFRWNSYVRKQYKSGIKLAKKQFKEIKNQSPPSNLTQAVPTVNQTSQQEVPIKSEITFQAVIHFLHDLYKKAEISSNIQEDKEKSFGIIKELEKKTYYLVAENERLEKSLKEMEDDYRSLMGIMEKARKMVVLQDGNRESRVKFQMDKNGNLEKVE
jgi:hypothetical protein